MQTAMHIGVFRSVGTLKPVEHHLGLLCGSGIVEINERLAIDLHAEGGEVLA
jgi:hypothetical protein